MFDDDGAGTIGGTMPPPTNGVDGGASRAPGAVANVDLIAGTGIVDLRGGDAIEGLVRPLLGRLLPFQESDCDICRGLHTGMDTESQP